jgi:hypothetical protein
MDSPERSDRFEERVRVELRELIVLAQQYIERHGNTADPRGFPVLSTIPYLMTDLSAMTLSENEMHTMTSVLNPYRELASLMARWGHWSTNHATDRYRSLAELAYTYADVTSPARELLTNGELEKFIEDNREFTPTVSPLVLSALRRVNPDSVHQRTVMNSVFFMLRVVQSAYSYHQNHGQDNPGTGAGVRNAEVLSTMVDTGRLAPFAALAVAGILDTGYTEHLLGVPRTEAGRVRVTQLLCHVIDTRVQAVFNEDALRTLVDDREQDYVPIPLVYQLTMTSTGEDLEKSYLMRELRDVGRGVSSLVSAPNPGGIFL